MRTDNARRNIANGIDIASVDSPPHHLRIGFDGQLLCEVALRAAADYYPCWPVRPARVITGLFSRKLENSPTDTPYHPWHLALPLRRDGGLMCGVSHLFVILLCA